MRIHGGDIYENTHLLDFSANINPLGMPDAVRDAVISSVHDCTRYPDPHCRALTGAIAEAEAFDAANIVCGNGAADLIWRIVYALRPRNAVVCALCFSEYRAALAAVGCRITEYPLAEADQFRLDARFLGSLTEETDIVFLCTPNNPTGNLTDPELMQKAAQICESKHITLVCDECFLRFCENSAAYSLQRYLNRSCIILQAFTKLYAMPGLRLGYALCGSAETAEILRGTGQYRSVSLPAQAAGIAALREKTWVQRTVRYVAEQRRFLTDALRGTGVTVYDDAANFLLIRAQRDLADKLEMRGIRIRTCADFSGLTDAHFRIAVRTKSENEALISAVREAYV